MLCSACGRLASNNSIGTEPEYEVKGFKNLPISCFSLAVNCENVSTTFGDVATLGGKLSR